MDAETLKSMQRPVKERYVADPGSALVTLRAQGHLSDGVSCSVETGQALVKAGLHPASGGDGALVCSGDVLLQALVACFGVTMRAVSTSMGIPVEGTLHAEGDLDFRGTLGVEKAAPVGFRAIRLRCALTSSAPTQTLAKMVQVTERYCVVMQTLTKGVPVVTELTATAG